MLRADCDIRSPRTFTPEAQKALEKVVEALQQRQAHRYAMLLPFFLAVLEENMQLHGLIFQWETWKKDPLAILTFFLYHLFYYPIMLKFLLL